VRVKAPGGSGYVVLDGATDVPVGSVLDARAGTVALQSAVGPDGATQTGEFGGGLFSVLQPASGRGMTELVLRGGDRRRLCGRTSAGPPRATASKKRKRRLRRLWGEDDHGRFRTRGSSSTSTARGTRWLTEDRCDGSTLTRVVEGSVSVRPRRGGRSVLVRAGETHVVRARR
jgi:hypothetical protein